MNISNELFMKTFEFLAHPKYCVSSTDECVFDWDKRNDLLSEYVGIHKEQIAEMPLETFELLANKIIREYPK